MDNSAPNAVAGGVRSGRGAIVEGMTQNLEAPPWPDRDDESDRDEFDLDDDFDEPRPAVTLSPTQQADLAAVLDLFLRAEGCDNTLRAAERWAHDATVSWTRLRAELEGNGGYCDCEILFNVFRDEDPEIA